MDLSIRKVATRKDKIKQPQLSEAGHIPRINTSTILSGSSGSGKSLLLCNLLTRPEFLHGAFDDIFLVSPTGACDDIQKALNLPEENVFIDVMEGVEHVQNIFNMNRMFIEALGADKAPKYALIWDDCVGDRKLMNHPFFVKSFIACRHFNATTFICTQAYTAVPKRCRMQCANVILFACSYDELRTLAETYTPSGMTKREFMDMTNQATAEPYSFLYINLTEPHKTRYRKCFTTLLNFNR
jgi:hypothetical protein